MGAISTVEYVTRDFDFDHYGRPPRFSGARDPYELWKGLEERVFKLVRSDLDAGWEVDQAAWGPGCLKIRYVSEGISSWGLNYWIGYILVSLITFGIGFFILPFTMKQTFTIITGAEIRLRRRA